MSEGSGREQMERRLVQRSLREDAFRQRLLEDPKAAVEKELGVRLPEEVRVVALEESADTMYLVLPSASPASDEGGELSDRELEAVAGGWAEESAPTKLPTAFYVGKVLIATKILCSLLTPCSGPGLCTT
jgi:hypothetical protein